MRAVTEPKKTQ